MVRQETNPPEPFRAAFWGMLLVLGASFWLAVVWLGESSRLLIESNALFYSLEKTTESSLADLKRLRDSFEATQHEIRQINGSVQDQLTRHLRRQTWLECLAVRKLPKNWHAIGCDVAWKKRQSEGVGWWPEAEHTVP